jgi:hypothetical protein
VSRQLDIFGKMGMDIHTEISDQDKKIDHIGIQMDKTNGNIDHVTIQTSRLLKFISNNTPYYISMIIAIYFLSFLSLFINISNMNK